MTAHQVNELMEYFGVNAANAIFLAITFRWHDLIPPTDRWIEWGLGLAVGVSLLAYNTMGAIKRYHEIKKQRNDRGN